VETHRNVFLWVLGVIADPGLLKGETVGVDATTLQANAAMRFIVRRDNEPLSLGRRSLCAARTPTDPRRREP
jgi:hypothetical protein